MVRSHCCCVVGRVLFLDGHWWNVPHIATPMVLFLVFDLFQSFVGILLMKQPFFIGGIEDVEVAKGSAFGAAGTFFFTFLISILYMIKEGRQLTVGGSGFVEGRGHTQRFGEYSTVDVVDDHYEPDPSYGEGSFT